MGDQEKVETTKEPAVEPAVEPVNTDTKPTEKMYTKTELEEFLTKARSDEKSKVYGEVEKLEKELKETKDSMTEIQTKYEQLETLLSEKDESIKSLEDKSLTDTERLEKRMKEDMGILRAENEVLSKSVDDLKGVIESKDLELYKEKAIAAAGDEIIPEMVSGKTEEEVNASIEKAKLAYADVKVKASKTLLKDTTDNSSGKPINPDGDTPASRSAEIGANDAGVIGEFAGLSQEEFSRRMKSPETMEQLRAALQGKK